jgi:ketosteroid isomerase-like protein
MTISERRARELLYAAHDAFNRRDIDGLLDLYADDITYWSNFGGPDGGPLTIHGREHMRAFLMQWSALQSLSVPDKFRFENGLGYASAEFFMKDLKTGHDHSALFRQVVSYRDNRILRIEEYHDGQALMAFIAMLGTDEPSKG